MQKYIVDAPDLALHGREVSAEYRGSGKMRIRTESGSYVFQSREWKCVGQDQWVGTHPRLPTVGLRPTHPLPSCSRRSNPVGLRPKSIAYRQQDAERAVEIAEAIKRYASALKPVPQDWLDELHDLIESNQPEE